MLVWTDKIRFRSAGHCSYAQNPEMNIRSTKVAWSSCISSSSRGKLAGHVVLSQSAHRLPISLLAHCFETTFCLECRFSLLTFAFLEISLLSYMKCHKTWELHVIIPKFRSLYYRPRRRNHSVPCSSSAGVEVITCKPLWHDGCHLC